jgi:peptidoglycan lytic transglycosylase A
MAAPLHGSRRTAGVAALVIAACIAIAGCQTVPPPTPTVTPPAPVSPRAAFTPAAWGDLPGFAADPVAAAWPAFAIGCRALLANPKTQSLWQTPCADSVHVDGANSDAVRAFFQSHFSPYRIAAQDGNDVGLVTGYYEPLLFGSRASTPQFAVPLYAPPDDLLTIELSELYPELKDKRVRGRVDGKKVVPYWSRAELERGAPALAGKALVFVADPVEAFFLEIQGSGRIELTDGAVIRLNYADQNGHPYRSIGRVLSDRGELALERTSMQNIRAWAQANPDKLRGLLDENPSYVFFREVAPPAQGSLDALIDGPLGSLGVPLLAGRTIAVDARAIPLGAPVFLATTRPSSDAPLARLVLAQDTGGAIRGPVRADFFWGFGAEAGREAGRMRQQGRMWLLWPKGAPLP